MVAASVGDVTPAQRFPEFPHASRRDLRANEVERLHLLEIFKPHAEKRAEVPLDLSL